VARAKRNDRVLCAVALAAALTALPPCVSHAAPVRSVAAQRTELVVSLPDERVRRSAALVGAELEIDDAGTPRTIRIDAVEREADTGLWLHSLSVRAESGAFEPFCEADADGRRLAFPLAGRSKPDGRLVADPKRFELVCTSGAQGKCVRFGYAPWRDLDTYNACVRMVRADYCGDGEATTRDGTVIDIYDAVGVQKSEGAEDLTFEAGWTADGAACVAHPRVAEHVTLAELEARCPRLRGLTGPGCTEARARERGARLFNRSKP
jgi:hypothetical protein